jgi:8-oxo-dGTP pyrophosphatase MutT (NUDIX family)
MVSLLLLVKNNKFLLVKRSSSELKYSGFWGLPGGSVEKNETPTDALIREIGEELGISISNFILLKKYDMGNNLINVYVYNSSDFNENNIILNEEHTEFGFFSYYEINNMKNIIPTTITFVLDYLSNQNL